MNNAQYRFLVIFLLLISLTGCKGAQPPTVGAIQGAPNANIETGATVILAVNASGDNIHFNWETNFGKFTTDATKSTVTYKAPNQPGSASISVTVIDRNGQINTQSIVLTVVEPATRTFEPTLNRTPVFTQTSPPTVSLAITPSLPLPSSPTPLQALIVMQEDGKLAKGLDMGVNTSGNQYDWALVQNGELCMDYPTGQNWGTVFITVGKPTNIDRPGKDLSRYHKLYFEVKGKSGGEYFLVGVKDNQDPDTGEETMRLVKDISTQYKAVEFPLSSFDTADLKNVYVVAEFVFEQTPYNVCVKNIRYLP